MLASHVVSALLFAFPVTDSKPAAALLPADTAVVMWCDDVAALRVAARTLPFATLLASGDHDELAEVLDDAQAGLLRRALPGVEASALADTPMTHAFVAFVPDDHGALELVIGFAWPEAEPEALLPMPEFTVPEQPGLRKRAFDRWTIVTRSKVLDDRIVAVAAGIEPTLAARARYASTIGLTQAGSVDALRVWLDPDVLQQSVIRSIVPILRLVDGSRPALDEPPVWGPLAWSARAESGHVASELFVADGTAPFVSHLDGVQPFVADWLALVPQDARAFVWMQSALPAVVQATAIELAKSDETRVIAGLLGEFADVLGSRVLIVVPKAGPAIFPVLHVCVELRQPEGAAQNLDLVMTALRDEIGEDVRIGREERSDGRIVYELRPRAALPVPLALWWTVEGSWLVATTQSNTLDDLIERMRGRTTTDVRSNPRFAEPFAVLTKDQSAIHGVSFVDPRESIADQKALIAGLSVGITGMFLGRPVDPIVGDSLMAAIHAAPASVAVTRHLEGGTLTRREGGVFGDLSLAWCGLGPALAGVPALIDGRATRAVDVANVRLARLDLEVLQANLALYSGVNRRTPDRLEQLSDTTEGGSEFPEGFDLIDPWGRPYIYVRHDDGTWLLCTLGADQAVGGEGVNADIEVRSESRAK